MTEPIAAIASMLQSFVDALAGPAIVTGKDLRVLGFNAAALEIAPNLRLTGGLALGFRAPEILQAARDVASGAAAEQIIWNESPPAARMFDVRIAPLPAGEDLRLLLTMRDMSESRRVERMRADFIANASHELRTPLASMLGFIETLEGPARNDEKARTRFLGVMAEQGKRMARLIDDLLSLSRIEQNLHVRPQGQVDLSAILRHICDTLGPLAANSKVELKLDIVDGAIVRGERDELVRVAENLVENAIKYSARDNGEPAHVLVRLNGQEHNYRLSIRDDGPGIAAEHITRLTERFYRVNAPASRAKGGTGLGLAIVKHIVARHRGRFLIDSKPGEGSTFSVLLDRVEPAENAYPQAV
jgi:two-component system, OmpR family, phosphate regulon sensor histidine kinase PhoR